MAKESRHGKRYRQCLEKVPAASISVRDAVKVLKSFAAPKFDMTIDMVMHLGIDPRHADQQLRGSVSLPHGIGKSKKVIAFCEGSELEAAKKAGAVEVGGEDLIKKILDGWMDFDVAVATPAMMKNVSKLGRVLGPSGKMPSPKGGTVSQDVAKTVGEFAAGRVEYRNDDHGNVHVPVGKMSFDEDKLAENIEFFIEFVRRHKPSTSKGTYIKKISISGSMTPGVAIVAN